jgi:hypothetical protein
MHPIQIDRAEVIGKSIPAASASAARDIRDMRQLGQYRSMGRRMAVDIAESVAVRTKIRIVRLHVSMECTDRPTYRQWRPRSGGRRSGAGTERGRFNQPGSLRTRHRGLRPLTFHLRDTNVTAA